MSNRYVHQDYYDSGYNSTMKHFDRSIIEDLAKTNITLAVIPDMRAVYDRDQMYELGVMAAIHEEAAWMGVDLHMGSMTDFMKRDKLGLNRGQRMVLMPRYGFLESTCRLHDMAAILKGIDVHHTSYLEPGIGRTWNGPNDFSYWYLAEWAHKLEADRLTPATWFDKGWANVPDTKSGAWVVKGTLRSVRQDWDNRMYADSREKLKTTLERLHDDSRISQYGLMIREYRPIMTLQEWNPDISVEGYKRVEFRIHIYKGIPFYSHYYWGHLFEIEVPQTVIDFALRCYESSEYDGWASVDVAVGTDGNLFCVEMNCGPSSGSPDSFDLWFNFLRAFGKAHSVNDAPDVSIRYEGKQRKIHAIDQVNP